jgi:hypothetical protein
MTNRERRILNELKDLAYNFFMSNRDRFRNSEQLEERFYDFLNVRYGVDYADVEDMNRDYFIDYFDELRIKYKNKRVSDFDYDYVYEHYRNRRRRYF